MEMDELKRLWAQFGDVPVDSEGNTEEAFLNFEAGTFREEVWEWFERQNPGFVVGDIMGGM